MVHPQPVGHGTRCQNRERTHFVQCLGFGSGCGVVQYQSRGDVVVRVGCVPTELEVVSDDRKKRKASAGGVFGSV